MAGTLTAQIKDLRRSAVGVVLEGDLSPSNSFHSLFKNRSSRSMASLRLAREEA